MRTALWNAAYAPMEAGSAGRAAAQANVTAGSSHSARAPHRAAGCPACVHGRPAARAASATAATSTHAHAASSRAYHQAFAMPARHANPCAPATANARHSTAKSRRSASPPPRRRTAKESSAAARGPSTSTQVPSALAKPSRPMACAVPSTGG